VIANGPTESCKHRVLLVEAGGRSTLAVKLPVGMVKLFESKQSWAIQSEPKASCDGRIVFRPRGRMLGGSSNMHAQVH
jgi:choline dehydrogenase